LDEPSTIKPSAAVLSSIALFHSNWVILIECELALSEGPYTKRNREEHASRVNRNHRPIEHNFEDFRAPVTSMTDAMQSLGGSLRLALLPLRAYWFRMLN
jgi:hypothetical protein